MLGQRGGARRHRAGANTVDDRTSVVEARASDAVDKPGVQCDGHDRLLPASSPITIVPSSLHMIASSFPVNYISLRRLRYLQLLLHLTIHPPRRVGDKAFM